MTKCTLSLKIKVSKFSPILYPVWFVQLVLGKRPYIPNWMVKISVIKEPSADGVAQ